MPGHLARDARISLARALRHACGLTRRYVSGEHLMTVLVSALYQGRDPRPARAVLHQYGATLEDVEEEIARRAGPGVVLLGGLDRDALAAIGIDLDAVRARIESSFGPEALTRAIHREPRPSGLKGSPSKLMLLARAHPDIFDDALWAVISKAKERKS
jgi:Clp amino terminal domain, pathogenicity island component